MCTTPFCIDSVALPTNIGHKAFANALSLTTRQFYIQIIVGVQGNHSRRLWCCKREGEDPEKAFGS